MCKFFKTVNHKKSAALALCSLLSALILMTSDDPKIRDMLLPSLVLVVYAWGSIDREIEEKEEFKQFDRVLRV